MRTPANTAGTITVAATPIGNLSDATDRLKTLLQTSDVVAAEDTRTLRRLAQGLGVAITGKIIAHHEHNEAESATELVELAHTGSNIVFISDAGMPTVSDPGFRLVQEAIAHNVNVTCAPGASAVTTALAVSGLASDRFAFEGFIPRKAGEKTRFFQELKDEKRTLIFYESPHRIHDTLKVLADVFGEDRQGCVGRELTKLHEEVVRGSLSELLEWAGSKTIKGEIVLLTAGSADEEVASLEDQVTMVKQLVEEEGLRLKDATKQVAARFGSSARELYDLAL